MFKTEKRQHVRIDLLSVLGQRVATLFDAVAEAGEHRVEFNGSNLSSGVYFYKLISESASMIGRMVMIK